MKKINVGIVGLGYWGPNLLRNFEIHSSFSVVAVCDLDKEKLVQVQKRSPHIKTTTKLNELLHDSSIDLIAIVTPPETHYDIGKLVLENNKHLWIEKPFTNSLKNAESLLKLAKEKKLLIHVDLPYLFYGPVMKMKELLEKKTIGKPYYFNSTRTNLGLIQEKTDIFLDLAPHDLSILYYLFPNLEVKKVLFSGSKHIGSRKYDQIGNIVVYFQKNFVAYLHYSWLSPTKIRLITLGGSKKMILFDDIDPTDKVKVYDKNIKIKKDEITVFKPIYRTGDVWIPVYNTSEALLNQITFLAESFSKTKKEYFTADIAIKILKIINMKK